MSFTRWITFLVLVAVLAVPAFADEPGAVERRIDAAREAGADFVPVDVFAEAVDLSATRSPGHWQRYEAASEVLAGATLMTLQPGALAQLQAAAPERITLSVPYLASGLGELSLDLVKVDILADDFQVLTSGPDDNTDYDLGVHYRGVVRGERGSLAAVSVFRHEVMGLVTSSDGELVLGRLEGDAGDHVIYARGDLQGLDGASCEMEPAGDASRLDRALDGLDRGFEVPRGLELESRAAGDCVELYFETAYNVYQNKGYSTSAVTSFVTGIFNQVSTLYANESIDTGLSQIYVWNTSGPYTATSASSLLSQFQSNRTSFNGDLGQVLKIASGVSGIAAGFDGLCNASRSQSQSASFIKSTYSTVPTFSDTVFVVAHEFGHLFGSRHTHACVWNGNNTAIDGCAGYTEGSCPLPGHPPGGGTIMSYCSLTGTGVDFNNGFGSQPGDVIRGEVAAAGCLAASCGGGGGSPPPTPSYLNVQREYCLGYVSLSWPSTSGATSYDVQRSSYSSYAYPVTIYSGSNTFLFHNGGTGTKWYRVRACNSHGCSGWRNGNRTGYYYNPCL